MADQGMPDLRVVRIAATAARHQRGLGLHSAVAFRQPRQVHCHRKGRSLQSGWQAHLRAAGSHQLSVVVTPPHKRLSGEHCVDDFHYDVALHVSNFLDDRGPVGTHHHRETVTEVPHPDRISVSAQDVFLRQVVLVVRQCDGRVTQHDRKVTCDYGLGPGATDYRATAIHVH